MKRRLEADRRIMFLGRLWVAYGALSTLGAIAGALIVTATGTPGQALGEIISLFVLVSVPGIGGGLGLLKRRPWARILLLALSIINLFSFPPVGTALGAYTLWVLLRKESRFFFRDGADT